MCALVYGLKVECNSCVQLFMVQRLNVTHV